MNKQIFFCDLRVDRAAAILREHGDHATPQHTPYHHFQAKVLETVVPRIDVDFHGYFT